MNEECVWKSECTAAAGRLQSRWLPGSSCKEVRRDSLLPVLVIRPESHMTKADVATTAFLADKQAAAAAMPWQSFTPAEELVGDKEYYCVSTWGIMSLTAMPVFWSTTGQINALIETLPRGQCVGRSRAIRLAWPFSFVAETLTVWHDREYATAFFRSDVHQQGMQALRGRVEFRAHRVWVRGLELPLTGDTRSTSKFWSAVKSGERFRKV